MSTTPRLSATTASTATDLTLPSGSMFAVWHYEIPKSSPEASPSILQRIANRQQRERKRQQYLDDCRLGQTGPHRHYTDIKAQPEDKMFKWFLQTQFIFLMNINETFYNLRKGVTGLKFSDVMPELEEANHFVVSLEEFNRTIRLLNIKETDPRQKLLDQAYTLFGNFILRDPSSYTFSLLVDKVFYEDGILLNYDEPKTDNILDFSQLTEKTSMGEPEDSERAMANQTVRLLQEKFEKLRLLKLHSYKRFRIPTPTYVTWIKYRDAVRFELRRARPLMEVVEA